MIDIKRNFIILDGKIIYPKEVSTFAIQRAMLFDDGTDVSKLQPGIISIILNVADQIEYYREDLDKSDVGIYLKNNAFIFTEPKIKIRKSQYNQLYYALKVESDKVKILFEHNRKYPTLLMLRPLISLISE